MVSASRTISVQKKKNVNIYEMYDGKSWYKSFMGKGVDDIHTFLCINKYIRKKYKTSLNIKSDQIQMWQEEKSFR